MFASTMKFFLKLANFQLEADSLSLIGTIVDLTQDYFTDKTFTWTSLRVLLHKLGVTCHLGLKGRTAA
jgi:hypothetical protein